MKKNCLCMSKGYLLEIRKVARKPDCIFMADSTLSVEYPRFFVFFFAGKAFIVPCHE